MYEMMMNMGGFSLCNWINYGFSFTAGQLAWRTPLALQFVFVIALFVTVPWLPESPRWLLYHKKDAEAVTTLACLAGKAEDDPAIIAEAEEIRYSVEYEKEHELRWKDILRPQPGATKPLRRLLLGAGTQFMQQFGGRWSDHRYYSSITNALGRYQHHGLLSSDCPDHVGWSNKPVGKVVDRRQLAFISHLLLDSSYYFNRKMGPSKPHAAFLSRPGDVFCGHHNPIAIRRASAWRSKDSRGIDCILLPELHCLWSGNAWCTMVIPN